MSNDKCQMNVRYLIKIIIPSFVIFNLLFVIFLFGCGDLEGSVTGLTITPSSATVGINQSQSFSAAGTDAYGIAVIVSPSWSVTGGVGTISSNGLFTAGSSAGSGSVMGSYDGVSASAAITITDTCWVSGTVTGARDTGGVQNVLVALRNTSYSDSTDSSGKYSISGIPAGSYEVYTAETAIYQIASYEVTLTSGETETKNFTLIVKPGVPEIPTTTEFTF